MAVQIPKNKKKLQKKIVFTEESINKFRGSLISKMDFVKTMAFQHVEK